MRPGPSRSLFLLLSLFSVIPVVAQTAPESSKPRLDETRLITLHGTVHPLAQPQYDRGAVSDSFPAQRMLLMLKRPADREATLQQFLRDVHAPGSPTFHHWLTPDEFGARFGASDDDVQTVTSWLQSHGFFVPRLTRSRAFLEFSGTAAQVRETLHTEIHRYVLNGETHYSIASEPAIPEALTHLIRGFAPLNTFEPASYLQSVGPATYSRSTHRASPLFTTTVNNMNFFALAPEDFATQYDLGPVYKAGTDGTGQSIGILGGSNINLSLVDAHRQLFGLPPDHTQVVIDGQDPSDGLAPNIEGFLDVEVSGAVAPNATINFYIAGGDPFQSTLVLAAMRAIEDNQASVLSASFGECEQLLGESGNQLWSGLWEQAAAQGQTVFVSTGDTGPATCPLAVATSGSAFTFLGLSVNGLASTPWNVAVGGTDFFYSDFATGAPSAATLWNQTNDASFGSLKAPLPEQPWSDALGFNAIPPSTTSFFIPSAAGGGGPSSCSQSTQTPPAIPVCVAGYPKPSWQNAPGVPADHVRDIPDVSLFAANGKNFSAYPICAEPGDCAPVTNGDPQVFLVGGTSASTPAMAGIMALINQKFGRQGQANFTLYALANQQPSVFHDITIGTNDVLCEPQSPGCNTPVANTPPSIESYGVYTAGPGYDLASGIGSVDANALISNWNKITFLPTTTTLQLSPSSVVHGSQVNITASVLPASGSAVPAGDVNISTTSSTPLPQSGALPLSAGTASASIAFFPGGTYQVTAQYAGDGTFAASASSPTTLTVTPEPSTTLLTLHYEFFNGTNNAAGIIQNGAIVPFGSLWAFQAQPSGQNSGFQGLATGTATFTDGSTSFTVPLDASGTAVWSPQLLGIGSHSVSVSYSGDASYGPSTAGPINFTVGKGTARLTAAPEETVLVSSLNPPTFSLIAGSTLVVHVLLQSPNSIVPPSGNVTVNMTPSSGPALTQTLPLTANAFINQGLSTAFVTFANVPAATYTLSASYVGDSNWNSSSFTNPNPLTFAAETAVTTNTTLAVTPSSVSSTDTAKFTVTVQASQAQLGGSPQGIVQLFANGTIFASGFLKPVAGLNSQTSTAVITVPGTAMPAGSLQVLANYGGLFSFAPSFSTPVSLSVTPNDFTMSLSPSKISLKSGQSNSVPLQIGGPNGGSITLSLACNPSSSSITCAINSSASVNGSATANLTINAFVVNSSTASAALHRTAPHAGVLAVASGFAFVFAFLLVLPSRKRRLGVLLSLAVITVGAFALGCGGGSTQIAPPPPPPQKISAPAGTYTVLVTATSGGAAHNAKLTVIVQ